MTEQTAAGRAPCECRRWFEGDRERWSFCGWHDDKVTRAIAAIEAAAAPSGLVDEPPPTPLGMEHLDPRLVGTADPSGLQPGSNAEADFWYRRGHSDAVAQDNTGLRAALDAALPDGIQFLATDPSQSTRAGMLDSIMAALAANSGVGTRSEDSTPPASGPLTSGSNEPEGLDVKRHRVVTNEEQQPGNGLFGGCCAADNELWPCSVQRAAVEGARSAAHAALQAIVVWDAQRGTPGLPRGLRGRAFHALRLTADAEGSK